MEIEETTSTTLVTRMIQPGVVLSSRYEIVATIGSGGMATVYLAKDLEKEGNEVALKILHSEYLLEKSYVERFQREVQLMRKVEHRNVVQVFDFYSEPDLIYFTMEYVRGSSLEETIESCSYTSEQVAQLILEVCYGLKEIHSMGIMHRDLKPGNILIRDDGIIKITDFGVAREKNSRLTSKTQKVGSLCYMAPEIWLGKRLTKAIDFYSFGVVLYELSTGEIPFDHEWPGELMTLHLEGKVTPPIEKNKRVPAWLNELVMRLLSKNPKDRPKSAEEILVYIKLYASNDELEAESTRSPLLDRTPGETVSDSSSINEFSSDKVRETGQKRGKTYLLELNSTRLVDDNGVPLKRKRKATVCFKLPRRAAVVIEIESPSRDFIYLGVFLASLQVLDGVLTSVGLSHFGIRGEGNPLLRWLMEDIGPDRTLILVKVLAIVVVGLLTILAKRMKWVKDTIGVLSCIYLFAAIIPWLYLLSARL